MAQSTVAIFLTPNGLRASWFLNYTLRLSNIVSRRICVLCLIIIVNFTLLREAHTFIWAFVCPIYCSVRCATIRGFKCRAH